MQAGQVLNVRKKFYLAAAAGVSLCVSTIAPLHGEEVRAEDAETKISQAFKMKRCVNMGNALEAPRDAPWGRRYAEADYQRIAEAGFDTVRIPIRWSAYTGQGSEYPIDPDFAEAVDANIDWALSHGLNIVLNIHHFEEIFEEPAAQMDRYRAIWVQLSERYADLPDNVWFEVLNEPHKNLKGRLMRQMQAIGLESIRRHNPDRIVMLGGEEWSGIRTLDTNLATTDPNVVYTFHYYDPFSFTHQKAAWLGDTMPKGERGWGSSEDKAALARAVQTATTFREATNRPVFLGEFGVNAPVDNAERVKWAAAVKTAMEAADIPWCLWSYGNTFALYSDKTGWDQEMLTVLTSDQ